MESQRYFLVLVSSEGEMVSRKSIYLDTIIECLSTYDPRPDDIVLYKHYKSGDLGLIPPEEWPFVYKKINRYQLRGKYEGKAYEKLDLMSGDIITNGFIKLFVIKVEEARAFISKHKYDPDSYIYGRETQSPFSRENIFEWSIGGFGWNYKIVERRLREENINPDTFCPVCRVKGEWANFGLKCPKCCKVLG